MARDKRGDEPVSAYDKALGLLARREHSARELKSKLARKGLDAAASAVALAAEIASRAKNFPEVDLAVCPPFVYIDAVRTALAGSPVAWAQASAAIARNVAYAQLRNGNHIDARTLAADAQVARGQLTRAGYALAGMLNRALR